VSAVEKLLVVDDDDDLCCALADIVRSTGVESCLTVASLLELEAHAGEALRTGLAIVDVNLGYRQPSGIDIFHWLREHGYTAPIVLMTGHATNDPRVASVLALPNARLLLKPFSLDTLVKLLRRD
jgi:DNA-binding NtrC family response regulator